MYMSQRHQEGLAHLLYGIEFGGGFVALTGEVGTGKTTLCHCLLKQLPENIDLALILNSRLNALELVATLCDELGISYDKKTNSLKYLIDLLNQHLLLTHAKGRQTVLLIDEAQNLNMEVLEQLRLLTNLETTKTKLLRIILVGQPELKELLQRQDLRQLNQRITARYHLLPLSRKETRAYISHRLKVSHGNVDLFNDAAINRIYQLTQGIPRLINLLCDRSLLGAYATHVYKINSKIITDAATEILPEKQLKKDVFRTALFSVLIGLLVLCGYIVTINNPFKNLFVSGNSLKSQSVSNTNTVDIKPIPNLKFIEWLNNPAYNLNNILNDTLIKWGKTPKLKQKFDCSTIQATGLRCVFGKASWKEILLLNKPVILEFVFDDKSKHHALVTGFTEQQTTVHFSDNAKFPVVDILKYWEGYYLTLEVPELKSTSIKSITYQHKNSENILWLRYVLNTFDGITDAVNNPVYFDEALSKRVQHYQHEQHLEEDGRVGPKTLISLKNYAQNHENPHLTINE